MTTTTNVQQVKVNLMTQQQYDSATKSPNEFYVITDGTYAESFRAICYSTTFSEIQTAYNAGKVVTCVYANSGETYILPLNQINSTGAYFGGAAATGTTLYKAYCLSDGTWSFSSPSYQAPLVSGTNIKTINNTTVLGSGNFSLLPTTGGTLTGALTVAMTDNVPVRIRQTNDYSTATVAGSTYNDVQFEDYTGTRRSTIRSHFTYDDTGTLTAAKLTIGTNGLNSSAPTGIEIGTNTGGSWVGVSITPGAISSTSSTNLPNCGWVNDPSKSLNVVHRSGDETIAGNKTFSGTVTATTTNATVSTTQVCTTASARNLQTLQPITTVSGGTVSLSHNYSLYKSTPTAAVTYSFSTTNITQATSSVAYTFELCIDFSSNAYTVTWPNNLTWQDGEIPDISATGIYFFAFRTIDGGSTWLGNLQGKW